MKVTNGLDLQGQRITNLADPSISTDAASKSYVDNVAAGLTWKNAVRAASTANITLAAPGATIDGVTLSAANRVLLKNQSAASENGIWDWNGAASPLTRSSDADSAGDLKPGSAVSVTEGSVNADKSFMITSDAAITIGTTAMTWSSYAAGQTYTGGDGIGVAGGIITAVAAPGGGVSVSPTGIALDASIAARKFSSNVGNGAATSIAVTHGLGTKDMTVSVRLIATDEGVICDWVATDINTVTLSFAVAPATGAYRVTVTG